LLIHYSVCTYELHLLLLLGLIAYILLTYCLHIAIGTGTNAQFAGVWQIRLLRDGSKILIVDQANRRVRQVTPAGVVSLIAGQTSSGSTDGVGKTEVTVGSRHMQL
jgi:hypothetical protein